MRLRPRSRVSPEGDPAMRRLIVAIPTGLLLTTFAGAQQKPAAHPDLSGTYYNSSPLAGGTLKKVESGNATFKKIDRSDSAASKGEVPGALPSTRTPSYKPEFQAKVKDL